MHTEMYLITFSRSMIIDTLHQMPIFLLQGAGVIIRLPCQFNVQSQSFITLCVVNSKFNFQRSTRIPLLYCSFKHFDSKLFCFLAVQLFASWWLPHIVMIARTLQCELLSPDSMPFFKFVFNPVKLSPPSPFVLYQDSNR